MALNVVNLGYEYFPDPTRGRPVFNGQIFVGNPGTDPEVPANQKQITIRQEDGTEIEVSQPVRTGGGGVPLFNGSPVEILVDGNYAIKVLDRFDSQVYTRPNAFAGQPLITTSPVIEILFNTVADLVSGTLPDGSSVTLAVGQTVGTLGYTTINDGGANVYRIVAAATGTPDGGSFIDLSSGLQAQGQFPDEVINVKQFGARGDGVTDDTARIMAAEAFLTRDRRLVFDGDTYVISGDGEMLFETEGGIYEFNGPTFNYGGNIDRAIVFGRLTVAGNIFDQILIGRFNLTRTFDQTGTVPAATTLQGTGVLFRNTQDLDAMALYCVVNGFQRAFRFDCQNGSISTCRFGKLVGQNSLIDFSFGVGSGGNDFCSALELYGSRNIFNTTFFSNIVGTIGVEFNGFAGGRDVDNVTFWGGLMEARKERKAVFDRAEGCILNDAYWDPGGYGAGGGTDYVKIQVVAASVTAGSAVITKTAHGIPFKNGDLVVVTSSTNPLDQRQFIVNAAASNANQIGVNTGFIGTSTDDVEFTYYGAQIEFTSNSLRCGVYSGATLEQNVVTDAGNRNQITGVHIGYQRGRGAPLSFDPNNLENTESLMFLGGALANSDIYTYLVNQAIQATSGVGQMFLGRVSNGYNLRMGAILADPSSKASDAIEAAMRIFTSANPGGFHHSMAVLGDGTVEYTQGATGTENGTVRAFKYGQSAVANLTAVVLPTGVHGIVYASANAESGVWAVQADGTVTRITGTANTGTTDSGTVLTVFDNGTGAAVRNRLGVDADLFVSYEYS